MILLGIELIEAPKLLSILSRKTNQGDHEIEKEINLPLRERTSQAVLHMVLVGTTAVVGTVRAPNPYPPFLQDSVHHIFLTKVGETIN